MIAQLLQYLRTDFSYYQSIKFRQTRQSIQNIKFDIGRQLHAFLFADLFAESEIRIETYKINNF